MTLRRSAMRYGFVVVVLMCASGNLRAQTDPGPRSGPAGAGSYYPTLNAGEQSAFQRAAEVFKEIDSVSGMIPGEPGAGLGPAFNGNSCAMCHAQPAVGGSSPGLTSKQNPVPNPQVALATLQGATNTVPAFVTSRGPVREARFIRQSGGIGRDGGVHGLFTIKGRRDAEDCQLEQPDFATELTKNNVIFRIPTPLFGLGLVENTTDATLVANLAANGSAKAALGIRGRLNTSGNDGTVTRFGWKAQNKSLVIFAGEAYNVEQGVSNEVFPNERSTTCIYNPTPEDASHLDDLEEPHADTVSFALFMRLLGPPIPTTASVSENTSANNGQQLFNTIGCALCHTPSLTTAASSFTGMSNVPYHPYSDFALHQIGSHLADGIYQGLAGSDEFRTAPLWGVGQRLFFLHDGRTSDLLEAIQTHASQGAGCSAADAQQSGGRPQLGTATEDRTCASEANGVISQFNALTVSQRQDILNFLRTL